MGMFSWCCKGCGHELKETEYVRMNGCKGEYDGYGRAGGFDYSSSNGEPSCWHELCYQQATPEQKLDEMPSKHAGNQGFGHRALEFMEGFDPKALTKYEILLEVYIAEDVEKLYVVKEGDGYYLKSKNEYEKLYGDANSDCEDWYLALPRDLEHDELENYCQLRKEEIERKIGLIDPATLSHEFDSLFEACSVAMSLIPNGNYYLCIWGTQKDASGAVYVRERYNTKESTTYEIGVGANR